MVAIRAFHAEEATADLLTEQRSRVRRNLCVVCGHSKPLCPCGEYERDDDRRDYGTDDDEQAKAAR